MEYPEVEIMNDKTAGEKLIDFIAKYNKTNNILNHDSDILHTLRKMNKYHINIICFHGLRDDIDRESIYKALNKEIKK